MDLKGKRVLVFGSGKSGIGAAELLGQVGACPVLYDGNPDLDKEAVLHKTASIKENGYLRRRASGRGAEKP